MGFTYLNNKRWSQITRDERFFCQHLYELIKNDPPERFIRYLHNDYNLNISVNGEWEIGFEVCFYRDLWQYRGRKGRLFSPKRTFDLCLFGENAIVIIEAKAATDFDPGQNAVFARDADEVKRLTGVDTVRLMGLCSSKYAPDTGMITVFDGLMVTWKAMAARYKDDAILLRADDVYEPHKAFANAGSHSNMKYTGEELVEAFCNGANWWVGRSGGIHGTLFRQDVETGQWRQRTYEVNTIDTKPPSSNFFDLESFFNFVGES